MLVSLVSCSNESTRPGSWLHIEGGRTLTRWAVGAWQSSESRATFSAKARDRARWASESITMASDHRFIEETSEKTALEAAIMETEIPLWGVSMAREASFALLCASRMLLHGQILQVAATESGRTLYSSHSRGRG